jgi:CD109 antigen
MIAKNNSTLVKIPIIPKVSNQVALKISAISDMAGDFLDQKLRVLPDGQLVLTSNSVQKLDEKATHYHIGCQIPPNLSTEFNEIELEISGNFLGVSLDNITQLSGASGILPTLFFWKYLNATKQLTNETSERLGNLALTGYQKQLLYRNIDGFFNSFVDESDAQTGSIYSTAIAVKTLGLADQLIDVDETVIDEALDYLVDKQLEDGGFEDLENTIYGGSRAALTAFVAISLSDLLPDHPELSSVFNNALQYLVGNTNTSNLHSLSLTTYALTLGNHQNRSFFLNQLEKRAMETSDQLYWNGQSDPQNLEISGYALLTYIEARKLDTKAKKIMKYLVNHYQSFEGVHFVAVEAITRFAGVILAVPKSLKFSGKTNRGGRFSGTVGPEDAGALEKIKVSFIVTLHWSILQYLECYISDATPI